MSPVVKTRAEGRKTLPRVLGNGDVNIFLSVCLVGKIEVMLCLGEEVASGLKIGRLRRLASREFLHALLSALGIHVT